MNLSPFDTHGLSLCTLLLQATKFYVLFLIYDTLNSFSTIDCDVFSLDSLSHLHGLFLKISRARFMCPIVHSFSSDSMAAVEDYIGSGFATLYLERETGTKSEF